ncbi:MAG TPA: hypothetical protein VFD03_12035 [Clostridia bacterium]|nr:hypothetical protein [Clostridia bacterium]
MKRILLVFMIVLSISFISGCKFTNQDKSKIPPTVNVTDYAPLTKGSYWEYEGNGNEYASFNRRVLFTQGNLAQISEDNGGTVISKIIEGTNEVVKLVYFEAESYQPSNMLETGFVANSEAIIIKSPLQVGTNWTDKDGKKEIVALDSIVDTPLGKIDNCLKLKITNPDDTIYQYYKKGIGLVKQEFISGDTIITSTIKKYQVEPSK